MPNHRIHRHVRNLSLLLQRLKAQGLIGRQHAYGLSGQKLSRAALWYHRSHAAVPGRDDGRGNLIGDAEGGVEAGVRRANSSLSSYVLRSMYVLYIWLVHDSRSHQVQPNPSCTIRFRRCRKVWAGTE